MCIINVLEQCLRDPETMLLSHSTIILVPRPSPTKTQLIEHISYRWLDYTNVGKKVHNTFIAFKTPLVSLIILLRQRLSLFW